MKSAAIVVFGTIIGTLFAGVLVVGGSIVTSGYPIGPFQTLMLSAPVGAIVFLLLILRQSTTRSD